MNSSTIISIPDGDGDRVVVPPPSSQEKNNKPQLSFPSISSFLGKRVPYDAKKVIHGIKVGISLVLVSLLYLLKPMYEQVGENAMWAIMTVVVVYEFFAGSSFYYIYLF